MGSRAVVVVCRDGDGRGPPVRRRAAAPGVDLHPDRPRRSSPTRRWSARAARPGQSRPSARPGCGTSWTPTGWSSTASCCPGRPRRASCCARQYAPVGAAAGAALDAEPSRSLDRGRRARRRRGRPAGAAPSSGRTWPAGSSPPTAGTAGRSTRSTTSGWPRSRSWPARATVHALRRPPLAPRADLGRLAGRRPGHAAGRPGRSTSTLADPASDEAATAWWEELTAAGGEGMVVKPADVVHRGPKGLAQPGIKCRGPGVPAHHLRARVHRRAQPGPAAVPRPRPQAVARRCASSRSASRRSSGSSPAEPLYRVHECVFGVLALESEPVDPRL